MHPAADAARASAVAGDPATGVVFAADQLDALAPMFESHGFALLRGLWTGTELDDLVTEAVSLQAELLAGQLPAKCGTVILDDPEALVDGKPFAHYVCHATEVSPPLDRAVRHPALLDAISRLLGPDAWLLDYERFGVVYQDARPGAESGYSRIGWHTDHQSGPHLDVWPSVAFTIHFDGTSPANGFLRVLPGSHLGGTDGMPPGFEKVAGEIGVYCERGDVLLHHCDLWHAAARATEDPPGGVRRHLRGGWYAGQRLPVGHGLDDFVKNAAR